MRLARLIPVVCMAVASMAVASTALADVPQRIWIANGQFTAGAPSKQNVVSLGVDGSDIQDGPDLGLYVTAITGWRDSLYVGTTAGIVRTDFAGNAITTSTACASPDVMAVDPTAPALYALCQSVGGPIPLMRMPLAADGSIGMATTVATVANRGTAMSIQGGYLYLAETYPARLGITRMPLANPSAIQAPWYDGVTPDLIATDADRLFYGSTTGANGAAAVTSLAAPNWQTASTLPSVSTPYLTDIEVRGSLLFSATGTIAYNDTSLYRQSITALGTPTELVHWTGGLRRITNGIYVGNQAQTWFTNATTRALADGAFAAPISASSGLTPTITSSTPTVCTVAGATVTPLTAGTCTLAAEQGGNAAYLAAPSGTVSIPITAPAPSITLTVSRPRVTATTITSSFTATGAGTATQRGTARSGARAATSVVVCSTTRAIKKAGKVTLTCALRKPALALRRRQALKVTLVTTFTPKGGAKLSSTQIVTVAKRR